MEIDITDFVRERDPSEFSASVVELGKDAAKITWTAANEEAATNLCPSDSDENGLDWSNAEKLAQQGTIGGSIFKGDDGRIYFSM